MSFTNCRHDDCSIEMINGEQLYERLLNAMAVYPTGLSCLDKLLSGGIMSGEVTEISGPVASGKTQFALTFCSIAIQRSGGRVLYVDTTGSFSSFRLTEIILSRNPNFSEQELKCHLSKLTCVSAVDAFEVLEVLEGVRQNLNNVRNNLKAIVVDHVGTILSSLVPKKKVFGFKQMMLAGRVMKIIAKEFNLAVLVLNQCVKFNETPTRPALGQWWFSVPDLSILFDEQDEKRVTKASVVKTCRYLSKALSCEASVEFTIAACGTKV